MLRKVAVSTQPDRGIPVSRRARRAPKRMPRMRLARTLLSLVHDLSWVSRSLVVGGCPHHGSVGAGQ